MITLIDSTTSAWIGRALEITNQRQQTYAHNLANAETPGFQPFDVVYRADLSRAGVQLRAPNPDGSRSVQPDREIARLSENALDQQTLIKLLNRHYGLLSLAIQGGKG